MIKGTQENKTKEALFAAGCFWGIEEAFNKIEGVIETEVGYSGGEAENPTYEEVSTGKTGHAETVKVIFGPSIVSYEKVLDAFWKMHDPTTSNRQGADVGSQYRSVIFYYTPEQKKAAEDSKRSLEEKNLTKIP